MSDKPVRWIYRFFQTECETRGVYDGDEQDILLDILTLGIFGFTIDELKRFKGLTEDHRLPDHLTNGEIVFSMLGETIATELARIFDVYGFDEMTAVTYAAAQIASKARRTLEIETGSHLVQSWRSLPPPGIAW